MKFLAQNKRAGYLYEILEKFEAGISLLGQEVKSIKQGRINLAGAYVVIRGGEAYLLGAGVPPYQPGNIGSDYDPQRTRKLLLRKREIEYLIGKNKEKGLTLLPLGVYTKKGIIKMEFALARGKKKFDKREKIRKEESLREIRRAISEYG